MNRMTAYTLKASLLAAITALQGGAALAAPEASSSPTGTSTERGIFVESPSANLLVTPPTKEVVKKSTTTIKAISKHPAPVAHTASKQAVVSKHIGKSHGMPTIASQTGASLHQVTADQSGLVVSAWLNKNGSAPSYTDGDKLEINLSANKDCSVMIFDFDGRSKLTQIFPNAYQADNQLKSGESLSVGGDNSPFDYQVSLPDGVKQSHEHIFVYAYPKDEQPVSVAMNKTEGSAFRSADMSLEDYKKLVNESKVYFAREVKVVPKNGTIAKVSMESGQAPNKLELQFTIDSNKH